MKKILLPTFLFSMITLSIHSNAYAAWKELGSNDLMAVYIDLDTVKVQGEKAQVISMLDFKKPGVNPKTKEAVNSIVGLNEYDCPSVSYRPIEYKEFSGNKGAGKVISDIKTPDSKFEPIVSESWSAGIFTTLCKLK